MKKILHLLSTGFILLCFVGTMVPGNVLADSDFQRWVKAFYPKAKAAGISRATYDLAFAGVTEPDSRILEKANYQAEFTTEIWDYLDTRINPRRVEAGLEKGELYWQILQLIEKKLGVEPQVLLAIWAMESNYGAIFERPERLFSVISALATLAYGDKKRKKFGESQLIAALQILQAGDIAVERMNGSWAGAMGHTQFIPTSYLAYGVDMDGDGRRDIWDSIPDALATAANLLRKNGWQTGRTWGYEVKGPAGAAKLADQSKTLEQWQQLGFVRVGSRPFPRPGDKAVLKVLGGENGPLFLMVKNFFVLKRYNNSDFYALSVGLMADRLAGFDGLVQRWPRPAGSLSIEEKFELQTLLKQSGFYDGEIDGYLGKGSREGIRNFLKQSGKEPDTRATIEVLIGLRNGVDKKKKN